MMYMESMLQAEGYRTGSGVESGVRKPVFLNSLEEREHYYKPAIPV
jgi:hypothetical protein